jgi:hydrogenase expression/formation protein HypC
MCLAIPAQIVDVVDAERRLSRVSVAGVGRTVNMALLDGRDPPVGPGDWVLIHVGFAISVVDEQEAIATLRLLEQMGAAYEQELHELRSDVPISRR